MKVFIKYPLVMESLRNGLCEDEEFLDADAALRALNDVLPELMAKPTPPVSFWLVKTTFDVWQFCDGAWVEGDPYDFEEPFRSNVEKHYLAKGKDKFTASFFASLEVSGAGDESTDLDPVTGEYLDCRCWNVTLPTGSILCITEFQQMMFGNSDGSPMSGAAKLEGIDDAQFS